jgi:glycopeptide antibiotics resistance protein
MSGRGIVIRRNMRIDRVALGLLLAYLVVLAILTLRPVGADIDSNVRVNVKPFATILPALRHGPGSFVFASLVGNVLAFVPLGLLLPLAIRRINWLLVIICGGLLSMAIELTQYALSTNLGYGYRRADVDDVIVNVLGTIVGLTLYGMVQLTASIVRRVRSAG